jgi:hypothetical protein
VGFQGVTSYKNLNNNSTSPLVHIGNLLTAAAMAAKCSSSPSPCP